MASHRNLDGERSAATPAVASLVALAFVVVACGGHETTASRSAAAYDEAQRKGTPVEKGAAHGGHAAPAVEKRADAAPADPHAGHAAGAASSNVKPAGDHAGHAAMPGMAGMDHGRSAGSRAHEQHATTAVGHSEMPSTQHSKPVATDHAAMGHGAPMPPPAPEPPAASAQPGQPAATLQANDIDAPAATSLSDAERSAAIAKEIADGHGMQHGTPYRQLDAGRDGESHATHQAPAPRPSPSPTPKPSPHRQEGS